MRTWFSCVVVRAAGVSVAPWIPVWIPTSTHPLTSILKVLPNLWAFHPFTSTMRDLLNFRFIQIKMFLKIGSTTGSRALNHYDCERNGSLPIVWLFCCPSAYFLQITAPSKSKDRTHNLKLHFLCHLAPDQLSIPRISSVFLAMQRTPGHVIERKWQEGSIISNDWVSIYADSAN